MNQKRKNSLAKFGAAMIAFALLGNSHAADNTSNAPVDKNNTAIDENNMPALDTKHDPFEGFNRVMYNFNDLLDRAILKPVATFYNKVMPKPLNKGIKNFYANIDTIPTVFNDILQANFY